MLEIDKVYWEDCLEGMKRIDDNSVNVIIADPPYETSNTVFTENLSDLKKNNTTKFLKSAKWKFDLEWFNEIPRILKPGGAWYVFMNDEGFSHLLDLATEIGLKPMRRLIWCKTNSMPSIPRKNYRSSTETLLYGIKGSKVGYFGASNQQEIKSYFEHPIVGGKERTKHPTQKPLKLIELYIKISCPPDGVALDPFMGSGTTAIACLETNRHYIGFENNDNYFNIANKRIEEWKQTHVS